MIRKLNKSQAFGRDTIDSSTLKLAAPIIIEVITHVINLSLCSGEFPAKWKLARVIPLLTSKELDQHSPSSYRPISLLPVISKLAERSIQSQLLNYLEESGQLSPAHHAYRSKLSTITALIHMMDSLSIATDENQISATMCVDLSAAFDCVTHVTLLDKLEFYGLDSLTKKWIKSYLSARSSYVVIGSGESNILNTPHGVPQGSVLGPICICCM